MIAQVTPAYAEYPLQKTDFGSLILQFCFEKILLLSHRDNIYKIPHIIVKEGLHRVLGALPVCIAADLAQACLVAREVMGEVDGDIVGDDDVNDACE